MRSNGEIAQETALPSPASSTVTADDIHRQQRANLALRALDLEAENYLLQQEVQLLKKQIEELGAGSVPYRNLAPLRDAPDG